MKKILLATFLFFLSLNSNADVYLSSWNVEGYSASDSPSGVNITFTKGVEKTLSIKFNMTRDNSGQFDSFRYDVLHTSLDGTRTTIPGPSYVTYNWMNSYSLSTTFSFTIPADKSEGKIQLVLTSYFGNQTKGSPTIGSYSLNYTTPPPVVINPVPVVEGDFYRVGTTGAVYIGMDGKMRHIQDANTLYGVFKGGINMGDESHSVFIQMFAGKIGSPIGPNTRLVEDTNNGQVYYQEEGVLRYITSPGIANRYKFDLKKAQKIHGTGGYTFGPTFN